MNKWIEILLGLILLIGIILFSWYSSGWGSFWNFRHSAWEFFKGGIVWIIAILGIILLVLGISDLRE
jgi:hypothetical protein